MKDEIEIHELPQFFGVGVSKYCIKIPTLKGLGQDGLSKPTFVPKPHNKGSHTIMLVIVISPHQCAYSG